MCAFFSFSRENEYEVRWVRRGIFEGVGRGRNMIKIYITYLKIKAK